MGHLGTSKNGLLDAGIREVHPRKVCQGEIGGRRLDRFKSGIHEVRLHKPGRAKPRFTEIHTDEGPFFQVRSRQVGPGQDCARQICSNEGSASQGGAVQPGFLHVDTIHNSAVGIDIPCRGASHGSP